MPDKPEDKPRGFEHDAARYVTYAARVARLPSAVWDRLRLRCADLDGPAFRALLKRTAIAARPYGLWLPGVKPTPTLQAIRAASRIVQTSIAFAHQVVAEFETPESRAADVAKRRTLSSGSPRIDALVHASMLIESTLAPLEGTGPGVATVLRAAGQAVLRHDWLSDAEFESVYRYVEPEIPFASLDTSLGDG